MSAVFSWDESFLTGLSDVDEQHRQLVNQINDLGELILAQEQRTDGHSLPEARQFLIDYAARHFAHEEALMQQYELESEFVQAHCNEHRTFAQEATRMSEALSDTDTVSTKRLLDYLVNWLAYHILGMDHSMARQIEDIRTGVSPAAALAAEQGREKQKGTEPLLNALQGLFLVISERNRELRESNRTLEQRVRQRTQELEDANRQLRYMADFDELTDLPNRRHAMRVLDDSMQRWRADGVVFSVLLMDADKFKQVNDTFGHAEGDQVLRHVAQRLRAAVRDEDIVCRLGGDEFLVICPGADQQQARRTAANLRESREPYCNSNGTQCWDGSLSIGVATVNSGVASHDDLLAQADRELYEVKKGTRS